MICRVGIIRRIILHLMCRVRAAFSDHGGEEFQTRYASELRELEPMCEDGLLEIHDDSLRVTQLGRLFVRNICMVFDAYLKKEDGPSSQRYSRTV